MQAQSNQVKDKNKFTQVDKDLRKPEKMQKQKDQLIFSLTLSCNPQP